MEPAATRGKSTGRRPTGKLLGRFLTLKSILRRGGFEQGRHFEIVNPADIHLGLKKAGKDRSVGDFLTTAVAGVFSTVLLKQLEAGVQPKFLFTMGGVGALGVYAFSALFSRARKNDELAQLAGAMKSIGEIEKRSLKRGPVTHLVFSRYNGKMFLLNREAADYLKKAKPGKAFGFMPQR